MCLQLIQSSPTTNVIRTTPLEMFPSFQGRPSRVARRGRPVRATVYLHKVEFEGLSAQPALQFVQFLQRLPGRRPSTSRASRAISAGCGRGTEQVHLGWRAVVCRPGCRRVPPFPAPAACPGRHPAPAGNTRQFGDLQAETAVGGTLLDIVQEYHMVLVPRWHPGAHWPWWGRARAGWSVRNNGWKTE